MVKGLPLFGGAQLAVDTTLVSAHHCDGTARPRAAHVNGVALTEARRRKEKAYPELVGPRSRAKLVVLAGDAALGSFEFCVYFLHLWRKKRSVKFLWRMPMVPDLQSDWPSLLHCARWEKGLYLPLRRGAFEGRGEGERKGGGGRGREGLRRKEGGRCREGLMEVGFEAPEWGDLARGARPDYDPMVDRLQGTSRHGWQKASDAVENRFLVAHVWPTWTH